MVSYEKMVTLFDTPEHAEAAKRNLESAGFSGSEISVVSNDTLGSAGQTLHEPRLWYRLLGRDMEKHEALVYSRTVGEGGVALAIRVAESEAPRVMGVLNAHKVVDVQDRALEHGLISAQLVSKSAGMSAVPAPTVAITAPIAKEEVLRLAEEQLDIGKRLVQEGTTRVRRFVTESPVEAKVTLHEEHAQVVRRAVSDPNFLNDIDWSDKTVEIAETSETAVASKSAHIAEEVVISRKETDHVETVRDTVRRQEIDVEQVPPSDSGTTDQKKTA